MQLENQAADQRLNDLTFLDRIAQVSAGRTNALYRTSVKLVQGQWEEHCPEADKLTAVEYLNHLRPLTGDNEVFQYAVKLAKRETDKGTHPMELREDLG